MNNIKKPQIIFCLIAGIGMFFPLYVFSSGNETESYSFMEMFKHYEASEGMGIIDCKIVLGVLIVAFIILLIRLMRDNGVLKIVSLLAMIAVGVLFYIDVHKLSGVKALLSSMMKYGIGYYMSLIGIIATIFFEMIELFTRNNYYEGISYSPNYNINTIPPVNNNPTKPVAYNIQTGQIVNNNQTNYNQNNNNQVGQLRLSDLVNRNNSVNNINKENNQEIEKLNDKS